MKALRDVLIGVAVVVISAVILIYLAGYFGIITPVDSP